MSVAPLLALLLLGSPEPAPSPDASIISVINPVGEILNALSLWLPVT